MPAFHNKHPDAFQADFHRRWNHLRDPHVRALAWLLDAPDLLDPDALQWHGRIASLSSRAVDDAYAWLNVLDREPATLHARLDLQPVTRLGRYAEKLMAFYFSYRQILHASGVQVRSAKNDTIGEFDFLLRCGDALVHWEFAVKFYLLKSSGSRSEADYFIGPNLADTLDAKMRKILDRQLSLAQHPAAQHYLPQPVASARALVKGWLFYHAGDGILPTATGVSRNHCRGFWCALAESEMLDAERYVILPRLQWLAPAQVRLEDTLDKPALQRSLAAHFAWDSMPVLVALLAPQEKDALETCRGFIVPDDWPVRAAKRISD
ncbi:MAG TPA: DUF1853 family protein [Burkholderiaceae bacterium]|nr:DUF1853 family protein [Burkholderiaceae bacterium]